MPSKLTEPAVLNDTAVQVEWRKIDDILDWSYSKLEVTPIADPRRLI